VGCASGGQKSLEINRICGHRHAFQGVVELPFVRVRVPPLVAADG
jgi:hypothetical protein